VRGPGGSADIGALSRGERLRSSRLKWLGAFSSGEKRKKHWKKNEYFETLWGGPHREKTNKSGKNKKLWKNKKKSKNQSKKKQKSWGLGRVSQESQNIFFSNVFWFLQSFLFSPWGPPQRASNFFWFFKGFLGERA
jgi:hypothetical protein